MLLCGATAAMARFAVPSQETKIVSHEVDPKKGSLSLVWKDGNNHVYGNFGTLITELEHNGQDLVFAMNGGMYMADQTPLGLYIENGNTLRNVNKVQEAHGNFYLQPNGIFYITKDNKAVVCTTPKFDVSNVKYATQSGPMLVIDGKIHPKFTEVSSNVHIRNGVGILPNGNVLFAISTEKVNLFDFATFFQSKGCKNALYLDGFVSRMYLPEKGWNGLDGNFGVIISEIKGK
ncbi:MAG: hypothetical protein GC178_01300 [Flavobacteriales bacterium]|nr:hypothetical protein [Flavobacteriales bacterium]